MQNLSMFEIMDLPEESLKQILRQAPARALARLFSAYPRTVRQTFTTLLTQCVSPATLEFLHQEIRSSELPSFSQIRQAEQELFKIAKTQKLLPPPALSLYDDRRDHANHAKHHR